MPQIWLTYDELATFMNCDAAAARGAAAAIGLDRRRSRDGKTRAKLTPSLEEAFLESLLQRRLEWEMARSASELRTIHARMADRADVPQLRSAAAG